MMTRYKNKVLNISLVVFLIYVLFAFIMYEYFYLNTITEYVCLPYIIGYGLAFQFGEVFLYITILFELLFLFMVLYLTIKLIVNIFSSKPEQLTSTLPND